MKYPLLLLLCCLWGGSSQAQTTGGRSFMFLHAPINARVAGMGGVNVSNYQQDVSMFLANPALLTDSTHLQAGLHYATWPTGMRQGTAAFTHSAPNGGAWGVGVQFQHYGLLEGYDPTGQPTGTFSASDVALSVARSVSSGPFRLGVALRFAQSAIDQWRASALMADIGAAFLHPYQDLSVGLAIRHVGVVLQTFLPGQPAELPFDVQAGISYKPERMPFRFSVTAHQLYRFDIAYQDPTPNAFDLFGNPIRQEISWADKLSRHFVFGNEFVLGKHITARMGYHVQQRRELQVAPRKGLAGFSFGADLRLGAWTFAYARNVPHIAGAVTHLSVACQLERLGRKKRVIE